MDSTLKWKSLMQYEWSDVFAELPQTFMQKAPLKLILFAGTLVMSIVLLALSLSGIWNGQTLFIASMAALLCLVFFSIQRDMDAKEAFLWTMGFACMAMVAGSEIYYVADRMNTVFKFWFNGFVVMGLVFTYAFSKVSQEFPYQKETFSAPSRSKSKAAKREATKASIQLWVRKLIVPAAALIFFASLVIAPWIDLSQNLSRSFKITGLWMGLLLLGVFVLPWLSRRSARPLWKGLFVSLLALGLTYPFGATLARIADTSQLHQKIAAHGFFGGIKRAPALMNPTLDGMAFMRTEKGRGGNDYNKFDAAIIDWLNTHADKTETVLEAPGIQMYQGFSRMAIYTGLPTIMGWKYQISQQIGPDRSPTLNRRELDIRSIYQTLDDAKAMELLQRYQVRWIVVGGLEKNMYQGEGLNKFGRFAKEVLRNEGAVLYRFGSDE